MLFSEFALLCEKIEALASRLEMRDLIADLLPGLTPDDLPIFVRFIRGLIFPDWSSAHLGIGPTLLYDAVAYVAGWKRSEVIALVNRTGDAGLAVEHLLKEKTQMSLFAEELTLGDVYATFLRMADIAGAQSQKEKLRNAKLLYSNASPLDGRYLTRLMLEELRIGVGEGSVRDAIAIAFQVSSDSVNRAHQVMNDLGEVARIASVDPDALLNVKIELFRPVKMMLAQGGRSRRWLQAQARSVQSTNMMAAGSSFTNPATMLPSTPAGLKISPLHFPMSLNSSQTSFQAM